jgi:cytidine kinase
VAAVTSPEIVCVGGIFIDDIVFPDGATRMAVLGGGGSHTAAGVRVWGERPGLVAAIGNDVPDATYARLERDFDLEGVVRLEIPQARAWQVFEWDTRRTEIFRVKEVAPFLDEPVPEVLPSTYPDASAVAILRDAAHFARWRQRYAGAVALWEPEQAYMVAANHGEFVRALPLADIVSPNLLEAQMVYQIEAPERLVRQMLDDGAGIVALRMGEAGSLVGARGRAALLRVPAVPVPTIVDQTGAGNSYCGGFLVGWRRGRDLKTAACYGAVSASITLESLGLADTAAPDLAERRADRLRWCMAHSRLV